MQVDDELELVVDKNYRQKKKLTTILMKNTSIFVSIIICTMPFDKDWTEVPKCGCRMKNMMNSNDTRHGG